MRKSAAVLLVVAGVLSATAVRAEIDVGIAGPMTGPDAALGEQVRRGGEKAIADVNDAGGVLGQKLHAVIADDACDPKQALSVANDLVGRGVAVVIGHVCSSASIAASDVYAEAKVLEISPASTNPQFTDRGLTNVFRVCGRDDAQGPVAAQYLFTHLRGKTVAVVDDKQTYGQGIALAFKGALNAKGTKEILYEEITPGEKDYSALISRLKAANVEVLYYGGYYQEAALIVRQARDQALNMVLIGGDGLNDPAFWSIAGDAAEGTLMTFGPDAKLDPANAELVHYFQNDHYEPEAYTLYTYAAIQVWSEAARKATTLALEKVSVALRNNRFQTAIGTLQFNGKGDVSIPAFVVYVWKNGKPVYAENAQ